METFTALGLPSSLYTDRGSHYFYTPKAGEPVDKRRLTQVGRALQRLGIEHIPAYSPEARGRSERMFGTLQERLPKELKLAGITDLETANRFIADTYLPAHNARFAKPPQIAESAFVAADPAQLAEILCLEEERVVARDNTMAWGGLRLQLPQSRLRHHYVRATVKRFASIRTARWRSSTDRAALAVTMQGATRSASRSRPCCTRARRRQGVAWKRRGRRRRQRDGQS